MHFMPLAVASGLLIIVVACANITIAAPATSPTESSKEAEMLRLEKQLNEEQKRLDHARRQKRTQGAEHLLGPMDKITSFTVGNDVTVNGKLVEGDAAIKALNVDGNIEIRIPPDGAIYLTDPSGTVKIIAASASSSLVLKRKGTATTDQPKPTDYDNLSTHEKRKIGYESLASIFEIMQKAQPPAEFGQMSPAGTTTDDSVLSRPYSTLYDVRESQSAAEMAQIEKLLQEQQERIAVEKLQRDKTKHNYDAIGRITELTTNTKVLLPDGRSQTGYGALELLNAAQDAKIVVPPDNVITYQQPSGQFFTYTAAPGTTLTIQVSKFSSTSRLTVVEE